MNTTYMTKKQMAEMTAICEEIIKTGRQITKALGHDVTFTCVDGRYNVPEVGQEGNEDAEETE